MERSLYDKKIISLIYFYLLFPSFYGYLGSSLGQSIYTFVSLLVLFLFLFQNRLRLTLYRAIVPIVILYSCLTISYCVTLCISSIFYNITLRDIVDLSRPLLYLIYYIIPISLYKDEVNYEFIIKHIMICVIIISIFDIIKFAPESLPLMKLYSPFEYGSMNFIRFSGTVGYCYSYGYLLLLPLSYIMFFQCKFRIIFLMLIITLILLTGSRSIILGAIFVMFFFYLWSNTNPLKKILYLFVVILIFAGLYILLNDVDLPIIKYTLGYVERMVLALSNSGEGDGSLSERSRQMYQMFDSLNLSPLFGLGPQKDLAPIEIMFGYYLSSWGIIGTIIYILIISFYLKIAFYSYQITSDRLRIFSLANLIWILSIIFAGMSTPILDQVRISQFFYLIQSFQFIIYYKHKNVFIC